jgi:beta-galactosidase
MNKFFAGLISGASLSLACLATSAWAANSIELKGSWQVQPATTVKKAPVAKDWGKWALRNWRWSPKVKGVPWSNIDKAKVHNIWLKTSFAVPADWRGGKVSLDFQRLEGDAIVLLNGVNLGERLRPYGSIEISRAVNFGGDNELLMFMTRDYTDISRGTKEDPLRYASRKDMKIERLGLGVTAPVRLERIARPAGIADLGVATSWKQKSINFDLSLDSAQALKGLSLEARIFNQKNQEVLRFRSDGFGLAAGVSQHSISSPWSDPIPWELDKGYVYRAEITLKNADAVLDTRTLDFGFREVWTEGRTVYLNGHPARFRVEWTAFGITENSLPLLKMMGRNTLYYQPNPTAWWRDWAEVPYYEPEELALFDHAGIAIFMPVPGVSYIRDHLLKDEQTLADYTRETQAFIKRYRNHPSILAWSVGMNSFNPKDAIHPDTMGQRSDYKHSQAKVIDKALDVVKKVDPTRLGYCHADGNLGDIATSNCYPNFAPVQEYEDWPSVWASKGDMPYFACEFAAFYNGSLYKGKQFLLTEYAAMYFGEQAFEKETLKQLEKTVDIGVKHRSHGNNLKEMIPDAPIFWDLNRIFVVNTDRAWRTWGVNGWHYFNFGVGYGDPPEFKSKRPFDRYKCLKEKVTEVPDWVNPQFHTYRKNMQPLLSYVAGYPVHTDKDHAFTSGDQIRKQIAVIWDGPGDRTLEATWKLLSGGGKTLRQGHSKLDLQAGDITFRPIEFTAPPVGSRTEMQLELTLSEAGRQVESNSLPLQIFPRVAKSIKLKKRVIVFDPAGQSPWVARLAGKSQPFKQGMRLGAGDILVIGRQALKPGDSLPYTADDLERGLNVVVLEQMPRIWEGFGFKSIETSPRYLFPADKENALLAGLEPADLIHWRGSPDLLPEFKHARGYDVLHAPKVTNRNAVASCVLQIPQAVGFTPVVAGEFGLDYSALLTFATGRGVIVFSSLDLTDRVGQSPVPTLLAANILRYADGFHPQAREVVYTGTDQGRKLLERLQCNLADSATLPARPSEGLIIEYGTGALPQTKIKDFVGAGGRVVSIDLAESALNALQIRTAKRAVYKAALPDAESAFRGVTADLLRWRDALHVNAIEASENGRIYCDGLALLDKKGSGQRLFVQVTPEMLRERYRDDASRREAMLFSVSALNRLTARLLTNSGCAASPALVQRLATLQTGAKFKSLGFWHVLGPFPVQSKSQTEGLNTVFPGEKNAIAGDTNPNLNYQRADGKQLDFRKTAVSDGNGFIDLGGALNAFGETGIAYATKTVDCERAGDVTLRLGVDYFMKVWVNGQLVCDISQGHGSPKPNRHIIKVQMNKGENVITLKVWPGSKGFGFWANMSEPAEANQAQGASPTGPTVELYDPEANLRDPYEYHYW